jgi:ribulose-5-phosphate 4-epimerase/fuculose-1-phosphate aldolase
MSKASLVTKLVQAHKILEAQGLGDGTLGHITARAVEGKGFWIKRADLAFDEIQGESDLQFLGFSGERLLGDGPIHTEWHIHAAVFVSRPEINSVVHTHSSSAALLSACDQTILPLTTEGGYFSQAAVPLFRAPKAHIDDAETAAAMAKSLGSQIALLVRNHGIVTCGIDVAQATIVAMFLDRAARIQLQAAGLGSRCAPAQKEEMAGRAAMLHSKSFIEQTFSSYARRLARGR